MLLVGALSFGVLVPLSAEALVFRGGDQTSVPASESISEDLYAAGGVVTIAGPLSGDFLGVGGTVLVNSSVSGDLFSAGGTITVIGNVGDDVRVSGGTIVINGNVGGDVVAMGGQVSLNSAEIKGDVVVFGGVININAPVKGDLRVRGGQVTINAPVSGSVDIKAEKVSLGSSALLSGAFTYSAKEEAKVTEGAKVLGETKYTKLEKGINKKALAAFFSILLLIKFFALLVSALVIGLFFKRYMVKITDDITASPLLEFGRGAVTMITLPIGSIILLATIVGIPFGIIGLLSFPMLIIFGCLVTPIILGSIIQKKISKSFTHEVTWKSILYGVLIFFLIALIPFIGQLAVIIAVLMTIGAIVKMKWSIAKEWK